MKPLSKLIFLALLLLSVGMNELIAKHVPKPSFSQTVYKLDGNTQDIIGAIKALDKEDVSYLQDFANQFPDGVEGYRQVHDFILENVQYVADADGEQLIKSPNRGIWDGEGDCKLYSSIIAAYAKCKGDVYEYEATSYNAFRSTPTHIYCTVTVNGRRIPIDPVYTIYKAVRSNGTVNMDTQRNLVRYNNKFGQRKPYWHRTTIKGSTSKASVAGFKNHALKDSLIFATAGTGLFLAAKTAYNYLRES